MVEAEGHAGLQVSETPLHCWWREDFCQKALSTNFSLGALPSVATIVATDGQPRNTMLEIMMIPKLSILSLLALASLVSCATDVANRYYGAEQYPAKDSKAVELLWQRPSREFTVIADFQSRGESPEAVRQKAAKIGADAVIVSILGGYYDTREQWAGSDRKNNTYSRITGTAIKYKQITPKKS